MKYRSSVFWWSPMLLFEKREIISGKIIKVKREMKKSWEENVVCLIWKIKRTRNTCKICLQNSLQSHIWKIWYNFLKCGRALTTDHDENYIFSSRILYMHNSIWLTHFKLILRVVLCHGTWKMIWICCL